MATQKVRHDRDSVEGRQIDEHHPRRNRRPDALAVAATIGVVTLIGVLSLIVANGGAERDASTEPATQPTRGASEGSGAQPTIQPTWAPTWAPTVRSIEGSALLDLKTGTATRLPTRIRDGEGYAVSPDGSQVAFFRRPKDARRGPAKQIFVAQLDGTHVQQITDDAKALWPAWSPDGTMIAYDGRPTREAKSNIFLVDLTRDVTTQVSFERGGVSGIQFSPDGASIVYTAHRPGGSQVRIVPVTGGTGSRLVGLGPSASGASLSPDGALLSYICWARNLCLANADGSDPKVIAEVSFPGEIRDVSWSPDGSRIAYSEHRCNNGAYFIDVATGGSRSVATDASLWWVDDHTVIVQPKPALC